MFRKFIIVLNAAVFLLLIPILEIGPTHVFNPDWPAHARLHEVWQLITHAGLALTAIWLEFKSRQPALAEGLLLLMNGGFLGAYLLASYYGGSMQHSDGTEMLVAGIDAAFFVLASFTAGLIVAAYLRNRKTDPAR